MFDNMNELICIVVFVMSPAVANYYKNDNQTRNKLFTAVKFYLTYHMEPGDLGQSQIVYNSYMLRFQFH